ncbi:MAG: YtxH protein [Citricoccus sp.]|nr:YtxH protein [Citricoccus sp. WCRC_4]
MKRLITLGVGAAIGYLLGSREGRQNLDKFAKNAQKLWNDPKTQEQVHKAASTVKEKAPGVADKATGLADKAADSIRDRAPGVADKASAAAHAVADKATAATQDLADRAGTTSQQSDGGKHASAGTSYDTGSKESEGSSGTDQQGGHPTPGPSQPAGGSGPDRY